MRIFPVRSSGIAQPLYMITACVALMFQSYWLYTEFRTRKANMSEQCDMVLQQELLMELLVSGRVSQDPSARHLKDPSDVDSLLDQLEGLGDRVRSKTLIVRDTSDASTIQQAMAFTTSGAKDSTLYAGVRSKLTWLGPDRPMVLSRREKGRMTTYPPGHEGDAFVIPDALPPALQEAVVYQVHVKGFDFVVLRSMVWPILASLAFVFLVVVTLIQLIRTMALHRRSMESHARFTRNMTHELKIPISTLYVATEALEREHQEKTFYTGAMQRSLGQLSNIVDTVLETASLRHRRIGPVKEAVDLHALVRSVLEYQDIRSRAEGITMDMKGIPPGRSVYADREMLRKVIDNLVDNAVKYGGSPGHVTLAVEGTQQQDVITVADQGKGIAPEHHTSIFEPYFRASSSDVHDVKGYGLGLSYVREVARIHGGDARVLRSGPGGTVIALILPRHDR